MDMRTPALDSTVLRDRLRSSSVRCAVLVGVHRTESERRSTLVEQVAAAKARGGLQEEVVRVFEAMNQRKNERAVGAYERLLSAILNDVMPNEGKVRLLPEFKNGTTWLDVALQKGEHLEDIMEGNGGGVTNVLSTGLRFAALSRTANRKLMVLDEPACWLSEERVPSFYKVVSQVAQSAKCQTFFISHHDVDKFEGLTNIVELKLDENDRVYTQVRQPLVTNWASEEEEGIRAIELVNFRRHEHTTVPCFPGATAYVGDINVGKSTAVISALRAVGYGESDDRMIRHGQDECSVILHLERGRRVEMNRKVGRSPAVLFRLYEAGQDAPAKEGRAPGRNQAPEWVREVLGISRVDDLDIQLTNQKRPVFLLDDTASRRAQILSVGKESGHLTTLMRRYEEVRAADRETVKQGEAQLTRLTFRLRFLDNVPALNDTLQTQTAQADAMLKVLEHQEALQQAIAKIDQLTKSTAQLGREEGALRELPEMPVLHDLGPLADAGRRIDRGMRVLKGVQVPALPEVPTLHELTSLLGLQQRLERGAKLASCPAVPALPEVPVLLDNGPLLALGQQISTLAKRQAVASQVPAVPSDVPALVDTQALERLLQSLQTLGARATATQADLKVADQELSAQTAALETLKEQLGGECPLCGSVLPEHGIEHHAH